MNWSWRCSHENFENFIHCLSHFGYERIAIFHLKGLFLFFACSQALFFICNYETNWIDRKYCYISALKTYNISFFLKKWSARSEKKTYTPASKIHGVCVWLKHFNVLQWRIHWALRDTPVDWECFIQMSSLGPSSTSFSTVRPPAGWEQ